MAKPTFTLRWTPVTATLATAAGMTVAYFGYQSVLKLSQLDPFAAYRTRGNFVSMPGIEMKGVEMKEFSAGRLLAKAKIDRVKVSQDRQKFSLQGITEGLYRSEQGEVAFKADQGEWNSAAQRLTATNGVSVRNHDLDLTTPRAIFDRHSKTLTVPQRLTGKLYQGDLVADNLTYRLDNGETNIQTVQWIGKPSAIPGVLKASQGAEQIISRTWHINGSHYHHAQGANTVDNGKAEDGDVIVMAPHISHVIKSDVLTATGRISYFSGKANVVADKVVIYRKEHRAVFSGNVQMFVKPKKDQDKPPTIDKVEPFHPDVPAKVAAVRPPAPITEDDKQRDEELRSGKTARDYPLAVKAAEIEYWYQKGERRAKIRGNPEARQDFTDGRWRQVWTHEAEYDGEKDTMRLNSAPGQLEARLKNSIGDDLRASWLKFSTKEEQTDDEEDVEGDNVTGSFVDRSGDDPRANDKIATPAKPPVKPPVKTGGGRR